MLKLDLGAGQVSPEGFTPLGHAHGSEIYPLRIADGAADVIRASHCLEHFPHKEVPKVIADWVRALKPGGLLQIAVPDFAKIAQGYLDGVMQPTEGYTMGGQVDQDDFHKAIFDDASLRTMLAEKGLVLIRPWESDIKDCAALPVSLNIEARKPLVPGVKIRGIMTAPRLGFNDCWNSAMLTLPKFNIDFQSISGAFWDQCLTRGIKMTLEDQSVDYILTLDYDSVFNAGHVSRLIETVMAYPDVDALAPLQASRHFEEQLFGGLGIKPSENGLYDRASLEVDLLPVVHAHFGLTLLKASALRALPEPWFLGKPNEAGEWDDGKVDPDIGFWHKWKEAGHRLFLAPRVTIGHLELMVRWPDINLQPHWQRAVEWERTRKTPEEAWQA